MEGCKLVLLANASNYQSSHLEEFLSIRQSCLSKVKLMMMKTELSHTFAIYLHVTSRNLIRYWGLLSWK